MECLKAACGFLKGNSKQNGTNPSVMPSVKLLPGAGWEKERFRAQEGGTGPGGWDSPRTGTQRSGVSVLGDVQSSNEGQHSILHSRLKGKA